MLVYYCDVCGGIMPKDYIRPEGPISTDEITSQSGTIDICTKCYNIGKGMNIQNIVLKHWKNLVTSKEETNKPQ